MIDIVIAATLAAGGFASDPQPKAADDPNRRICRRMEEDTGTRMGRRRVCRTAAEWREVSRAERAEAERESGGASENRGSRDPHSR